MDIIGMRRKMLGVSLAIIIIGLISLATQGLNLGIDFTGGTIMDFAFEEVVEVEDIRSIMAEFDLDQRSVIQEVGDNEISIRTDDLNPDQLVDIQGRIEEEFPSAEMLRTDVVGPTIGEELKSSALWALLVAAIAIVGYISYRFEFRFAIGALGALFHDVLITLGIFSILGLEVDVAFIAALLTIVGYSINDTIVIYDRIREKVRFSKKEPFAQLANAAILDTLQRSINTSITTLLPILAILFLGGTTIQNFMIALLIGMLAGTYSSIFVASPILVEWDEKKAMKRNI
ncbi:protein translocase subunit SecF [Halonatronum saccharophilum]|uniref:protein translocase subunit SecF n=1 Tax=Halonatronum saccharophilum TaxID=150060 RepID=UPI000486956A|nr:protein translocase subunit SecF [Halonatronum saccharophilum]